MVATATIVPGSAADVLFVHTGASDYSDATDVENLGEAPPVWWTTVWWTTVWCWPLASRSGLTLLSPLVLL